MKKYYLHNGTEQQGPFDIDELKAQTVNKDTLVWYEGITDWTAAGEVIQLQSIFQSSSSPPLKPRTQELIKESNAIHPVPKSKKGRTVGFVIVAVLAVIGVMMVANNPNAVPGVKIEVNTPQPVVITSRTDGSKSGLFNARMTIYATVQNQGGDGNVIVTFTCSQGGKTYDRSKAIYMSAGQSQDLDVTFEEISYIDGKITYNVTAVGQ